MKTRALIVDDQPRVREALREILTEESGFELVGEATNGEEAVELALTLKPDIVIMDIQMRPMNGIEATKAIIAKEPSMKIIGFSTYDLPSMIRAMRDAGAVGYATKEVSAQRLLSIIHKVIEGHLCFPGESTVD